MSDKEFFADYTTEELHASLKRNGRRKGRHNITLAMMFEIDRRNLETKRKEQEQCMKKTEEI